MQCDKCGSDNTQRLEMVFESGTQNIKTTGITSGGGFGGGGSFGGIAATSTSGRSTSLIAKRASPPKKRGVILPIFFLLIGLVMFIEGNDVLLFGFISISISIPWIIWAIKYNQNIFPGLYNQWQKLWLCHKCGHIYVKQ